MVSICRNVEINCPLATDSWLQQKSRSVPAALAMHLRSSDLPYSLKSDEAKLHLGQLIETLGRRFGHLGSDIRVVYTMWQFGVKGKLKSRAIGS